MVYDYRRELMSILENTSSDPESLLQTQRSLTVILHVLNYYQHLPAKGRHHNAHNFHSQGHRDRDHYGTDNSRMLNRIFQQTLANASSENSIADSESNQSSETNDSQSTPSYVIHRPATTNPIVDDKEEAQSESVVTNPEPSQEELLARDHQYVVHRRLSGAQIHHTYYPEAVLQQLNFQIADGDVVELDPDQTVRGLWAIRRVTGQHIDTHDTPIQLIRYATLTPVDGTNMLQIAKTLKGDSIVDQSVANTIVIDPSHFSGKRSLEPGMVVDYAYYDHGNGLNDAQKGTIRWIHDNTDFDTIKAPQKPKTTKKVTKTRHEFKDHVDYDLKKKHVLIITGVKTHEQDLKEVVSKHGGVYYSFDASMEANVSSSKLKKAIKEAQMVIICTDRIHHRVSQAAIHQAKRHDLPYAMATTTSNAAVERAMYRALNGDPSYEAAGQDTAMYSK